VAFRHAARLESTRWSRFAMSRSPLVASLCVIAVACVTTPRSHRTDCELAESDLAFAIDRPVYRDCSVDRPARFVGNGGTRLNFQTPSQPPPCISADLVFVVDSTGKPETSTARLDRGGYRAFGEALIATLDSWSYEPAIRDGIPVRQIVKSHHSATTAPASDGSPRRGVPPAGPSRC